MKEWNSKPKMEMPIKHSMCELKWIKHERLILEMKGE